MPSFSRSRGSELSEDANNAGSLGRSQIKGIQENNQNVSVVARPDLLENAIVLADYHPLPEQTQSLSSMSDERTSLEQNVEQGLEASSLTVPGATPKRENPFSRPNL